VPLPPCAIEPRGAFAARVDPRVVVALRPFVAAARLVHRPRFEGLGHVPDGPALLVGNHGVAGYETPLFFDAVRAATGRHPLGLVDRWFFFVPLVRDLLVRAGGMLGTMSNARAALARGELVVCYPGGAREVLKRGPHEKYRLAWQRSRGFVRLAMELRVPVVRFAAAGVDDTYDVVGTLAGTGRLLMGDDKYDLPRLRGVGPLPRPVPFWFRLAPPERVDGDPRDELAVARAHGRLWASTQALLDDLVRDYARAAGRAA
jgi:1-acyl-sn-glycerol-3-phosphate acyltransferase